MVLSLYTLSRIGTCNTGKVCSSIPFKRVLILPCKTSLVSQICKHFGPTCGMNQLLDSMTRPVSICRTSATCRLAVPHSAPTSWGMKLSDLVQVENSKADSKIQSYINTHQQSIPESVLHQFTTNTICISAIGIIDDLFWYIYVQTTPPKGAWHLPLLVKTRQAMLWRPRQRLPGIFLSNHRGSREKHEY